MSTTTTYSSFLLLCTVLFLVRLLNWKWNKRGQNQPHFREADNTFEMLQCTLWNSWVLFIMRKVSVQDRVFLLCENISPLCYKAEVKCFCFHGYDLRWWSHGTGGSGLLSNISGYKQCICFSVFVYPIWLFPREVCLKCFETKGRWKMQQQENQFAEALMKQLAVDRRSREADPWLLGSALSFGQSSSDSALAQSNCTWQWHSVSSSLNGCFIQVWLILPDDETQKLSTNYSFFCALQVRVCSWCSVWEAEGGNLCSRNPNSQCKCILVQPPTPLMGIGFPGRDNMGGRMALATYIQMLGEPWAGSW